MRNILFLAALLSLVGCSTLGLSEKKQPGLSKANLPVQTEKSNLYFSIGQSYEENKMVERAIENYQEALKIKPNNAEAHFSLGKILLRRMFVERGLAHIQKAIEFKERYTEARNFLAAYYFYEQKNYKQAKIIIDESAKDLIYENQEETWSLKLKLDLLTGGKKLARKSIPKVISLPHKICVHRLSIATSLYKMDLLDMSLRSARLASEICVDTERKERVAFLKGLIFVKKKNLFVAEKIFKGIETKNKKFRKRLMKAQDFVRRRINSGM